MVCQQGQVWQVVGGVGKGGLIVRSGKELSSAELPGRLAVGSLILALEEDKGRLGYKLLSGSGPAHGWVSTKSHDKPLLVATDDSFGQPEVHGDNNRVQKIGANDNKEQVPSIIHIYSQRFLQMSDEEIRKGNSNRGAMLSKTVGSEGWKQKNLRGLYSIMSLDAVRGCQNARQQLLHQNLGWKHSEQAANSNAEMMLCGECGLPLGQKAYSFGDVEGPCLHGECIAQRLQEEAEHLEQERQQKLMTLKKQVRSQYRIGWDVAQIPSNVTRARKLNQNIPTRAMCCVALQVNETNQQPKLTLATSVEPAASVNLEYLSVALQVYRKCGRGPWFSLDPPPTHVSNESANDQQKHMLKKHFKPDWLVETCIGEVLFQADYYLKEASMGEVEQPVVGMQDTYALSRNSNYGGAKQWSAREWFMIRKASVQLSQDGVLIPVVKMGVEAREQTDWYDGFEFVGMQDARQTPPDHPMVKYAEEFTRNFDLIAERKSVIYNLREVAKAAVLAKFLIETKAELSEDWFNLASSENSQHHGPMEVPQVWHERYREVIPVTDGEIALSGGGQGIRSCAYGGVDLEANPGGLYPHSSLPEPVTDAIQNFGARAPYGLQPLVQEYVMGTFTGQMKAALGGSQAQRGGGAYSGGTAVVGAPRRKQLNWRGRKGGGMRLTTPQLPKQIGLGFTPPPEPLGAGLPALSILSPSPRLQASALAPPISLSTAAPVAAFVGARGVDLDLENVKMDDAKNVSMAHWGQCLFSSGDASPFMVTDFWSNIDCKDDISIFQEEGGRLLRNVFNPHLSDRRDEGDCFVPPSTYYSHVQKLIDLTALEEHYRQQRMLHFFNERFVRTHPGAMFPRTWSSCVEVVHDEKQSLKIQNAGLRPVVEHNISVATLNAIMPSFDKYTGDGTRFRIYTVGSLEVRTIQEYHGSEVIGAVFSKTALKQNPVHDKTAWKTYGDMRVVKAALYVEWCDQDFGYFVVVSDAQNVNVVTESSPKGTVVWDFNPIILDERTSSARMLSVIDCANMKPALTVNELKQECPVSLDGIPDGEKSKHYALTVRTCIASKLGEEQDCEHDA